MPPSDGSNDDGKKPKAGRVKHDSGGRAIWEWATETGKYAIDSTSRLLKRLDIPGLSLADDPKDEKEGIDPNHSFGGPKEEDPLKGKRQSFNPYESRLPPKTQAQPGPQRKPPARPVATPRPLTKEEQEAETKRGLLGRFFGRK